MKTFKRCDKEANGLNRVIRIVNCYTDCPFAIDKHNSFSCSYTFTCKLLNKEFCFDDNLIHFGVVEECPLEIDIHTDDYTED